MFGFGSRRPLVVAFDIIGTVFPLEPLRGPVMALGLPRSGLDSWFAKGLRDAFALTASGDFAPLPEVLAGALDELLAEHGLSASARIKSALIKRLASLPARPDAAEAFAILARAGFGIIALSNGAAASTRSLLHGAGLLHRVDRIVSVDEVQLFKPRREVYDYAARVAGVRPRRMALVAVHPWDIHGANAAGWTTAYVSAEHPFSPALRAPRLAGPSLSAVARMLAAL